MLGSNDEPNVLVGRDGKGYLIAEVNTPSVAGLLGGDGSSIMVQAGPDNGGNVPIHEQEVLERVKTRLRLSKLHVDILSRAAP